MRNKIPMISCKVAEKRIQSFLNKELDYDSEVVFLDHVHSCPECMEELTIQMLVQVGLERLEDNNSFDVQKELDERMNEAEGRIHMHDMFQTIIWAVIGAGIGAVLLVIAYLVILFL